MRNTRPDVVVSFLSYFSVLTAVRAAAVGTRGGVQPADADVGVSRRRRLLLAAPLASARCSRWSTRVGYAAADLIVTTSNGVADDLVEAFGVARRQVRVVHNPVDLAAVTAAAAAPLEPQDAVRWVRPVIVAAGRLAEAKNYALLIDALALLRAAVPARLFILGQGDEERAIRTRVAAARSRGGGGAVRLSDESVEGHRAC